MIDMIYKMLFMCILSDILMQGYLQNNNIFITFVYPQ